MRIVILGGSGMLGHKLWQYFSPKFPDTFVTLRRSQANYQKFNLFNNKENIFFGVDALVFSEIEKVLRQTKPDIILNCIGITKRRAEMDDAVLAITVNSLLPHRLAAWGVKHKAKVVQFSTDCVFDGKSGNYLEDSPTCAQDIYGKTKALGELKTGNTLTLRSSFIGPELFERSELLEWFLSQTGEVKGFKKAIYSGLTTIELCRVVEKILVNYPQAQGLYNVSSEPISKYDLLMLIKQKMNLAVKIIPEDKFCCNRTLNSLKFRSAFKYVPPTWGQMIEELAQELKGRKL